MCFGILSTKYCSTQLAASTDRLILTGPLGKRFELPFARVRTIETGKWSIWFLPGLKSGGIQIHHDLDGIPAKLLFSAKGTPANEVAQELIPLGYQVP